MQSIGLLIVLNNHVGMLIFFFLNHFLSFFIHHAITIGEVSTFKLDRRFKNTEDSDSKFRNIGILSKF